ncbi:LLM class flavin-dependent oxidoreductase [Streptomyces acidicola]|uniref:LLM class flavin-dependent oxidoreductase n=1 Tax=Streptomyces acidicola TaxID=2596892 RepID=UPI0037B80D2D
MRFSVFLVGRSMGPTDDSYVIQTLAEHALEADRLGFDAVFLHDHPFTAYAPMSGNPFRSAAYLASRTQNVHHGFSVTTLPLHRPVRFAERVNGVDPECRAGAECPERGVEPRLAPVRQHGHGRRTTASLRAAGGRQHPHGLRQRASRP